MADPVIDEAERSTENASANNSDLPITDSAPMSKKAMKRLKKQEAYDAARPERLKRRKEQKLAKKVAMREAIERGEMLPIKSPRIKQTPSPLRILIDCGFDDLMSEKEIKSMASQITRCHSENKSAVHPCHILVSSFNKRLANRFHTVFSNQHEQWSRAKFFEEEYLVDDAMIDGLQKADLVYLTADSAETIDEIDESKVYIIGGIVDKNRHKYLCQRKAQDQAIRTARLPIGDYVEMASRKVLTCNHVFEIISRWLTYYPCFMRADHRYRDWEKAFLEVIPRRKLPGQQEHNEHEIDANEDDEIEQNSPTET